MIRVCRAGYSIHEDLPKVQCQVFFLHVSDGTESMSRNSNRGNKCESRAETRGTIASAERRTDERNRLVAIPIASDCQQSRNRLLPNPHNSSHDFLTNPPHPYSEQKIIPAQQGRDYFSAETRGFEPPKDLTPYLISSEAHSTGLCDVSSNL